MKDLLNAAGKSGLLLGLVGMVFTLLGYLLMDIIYAGFFTLGLWAFLSLLVTVGMVLYLAFRWRKSIGGFVAYKDAFLFIFFMLIMSSVVSLGVELLLYHVIEPDLQKQSATMIMNATEQFMIDYDVPDDQIDKTLDQMEEGVTNLSVGERLATFKWRPLLLAIFASILALFVRKEKPIFD